MALIEELGFEMRMDIILFICLIDFQIYETGSYRGCPGWWHITHGDVGKGQIAQDILRETSMECVRNPRTGCFPKSIERKIR